MPGPGAAGWGAAPPGTAGPPPPSPRRGGTGLLIALLVLVVLAVGGGAFALVSAVTGKTNNNPPTSPPASSTPASPSASASPTVRPTVSATGTTGTSVVAVSSAAAQNTAAPQVKVLLERYFAAINAKNYAEYSSLLDAQMQEPESTFASGYRTTQDTAETLTSLTNTSGGGLAATVSFTSRQDPADSIYHMACTEWTITLFLQPANGQSSATGYLIGPPPSSYQPVHQSCP